MPTADHADGLDSKLGRSIRWQVQKERKHVMQRRGTPRLRTGNRTGGNMNRLYILYDATCGLCSSVHDWAAQQPQLVPMEFVAANSARACELFPSLSRPGTRPEELIVVDDRGGVYREG